MISAVAKKNSKPYNIYSFHNDKFLIKNIDTGEFVDIRKMNQRNFDLEFSDLTNSKEYDEIHANKKKLNEALWEAAETNDSSQITRLITPVGKQEKQLADLEAQGIHDFTALHFAANSGSQDALLTILSNGLHIDVNARTSSGRTPLILATINGQLDWVIGLLEANALVGCADSEGNTATHYAAKHGHRSLLTVLLGYSPDLSVRNNIGQTAYDISTNVQILRILLQYFYQFRQEPLSEGYTRTILNKHMMHNSRSDVVQRLLERQKQYTKAAASAAPQNRAFASRATRSDSMDSNLAGGVGPDDFDVLAVIGSGSFGIVYLVEYIPNGEYYAMKVLKKSLIKKNRLEKYAIVEKDILKDFDSEFIVHLHWSFQTVDSLVMVMDYCPRGDLGLLLMQENWFTESRARMYLAEVILAIEYLHEQNVLFRDLKPDNVLVDEDGHLKLVDFGIAKKLDGREWAKSYCGSPAYLAPEIVSKNGHNKNVDWYLLGTFCYEMLTGKPPFFSEDKQELFKNIRKAPLKLPGYLSPEARSLLSRLLDRNPKSRLGRTGADEIKQHPFFADINWMLIENKNLEMPLPPKQKLVYQTFNKDEVFGRRHKGRDVIAKWSFFDNSSME